MKLSYLPILFLLIHHYLLLKFVWLNLISFICIVYYLYSTSINHKDNISSKKNKKDLKLTILIPAYNEEMTIKKCIESINNQTYTNIEKIVIVNDGSTDNTKNIIINLIKESRIPIKLINHKVNSKKCAIALNSGLKFINTKFILVINADSWFTSSDVIKQGISTLISKKTDCCNFNLEPIQKCNKWYLFLGFMQRKFKNWYFLNFQSYLNNGFIVNKDKYLEKGWKEDEITEDVWLSNKILQLNGTIEQVPGSGVSDFLPLSYTQLFQQNYRWVHGEFFNIINRESFFPKNLEEYLINIYYSYFILQSIPLFWDTNVYIFSSIILIIDISMTNLAIQNVIYSILFVIYNNICNLIILIKSCFEKEYKWIKIKKNK